MKISELIVLLEKVIDTAGDINVCVSEKHEYWGNVESYLTEENMSIFFHAQPEGPKSNKSERALVFNLF